MPRNQVTDVQSVARTNKHIQKIAQHENYL